MTNSPQQVGDHRRGDDAPTVAERDFIDRLVVPERRRGQRHDHRRHDSGEDQRGESRPDDPPRARIAVDFGEHVAEHIADREEQHARAECDHAEQGQRRVGRSSPGLSDSSTAARSRTRPAPDRSSGSCVRAGNRQPPFSCLPGGGRLDYAAYLEPFRVGRIRRRTMRPGRLALCRPLGPAESRDSFDGILAQQ